jgi:hypothetical protein
LYLKGANTFLTIQVFSWQGINSQKIVRLHLTIKLLLSFMSLGEIGKIGNNQPVAFMNAKNLPGTCM